MPPPVSSGTPNLAVTEPAHRPRSDVPFYAGLLALGAVYVVLLAGLLIADAAYTTPAQLWTALQSPEIRYAVWLSLWSCTLSALLSLLVAVPIGYLMSRHRFRGQALVDGLLDIPIVLPPLVVGLSLLILFHSVWGRWLEDAFKVMLAWFGVRRIRGITYDIPAVILAQFAVAAAFAVRTMRVTFDQISPRREQVAMTLGCNRSQAFWRVVLPEARRGLLTAFTLAWARSLGEFGPILIFAGATRLRTEVLSTTVFLELSVGNLEAAVAVSLLMIVAALAVLLLVRQLGSERNFTRAIEP
ncbi:MAG: ABC transporter permease subunit [Verrucomicrobia bacterium]|nr:ABC transporter permease subunit [Verrucomicrobiota bacterium]